MRRRRSFRRSPSRRVFSGSRRRRGGAGRRIGYRM